MGLRDKYAYAIQTSKGRFQGNAEERDGKLHFSGTVATDDDKNQIWNAIKTIPEWQKEVVARHPRHRGCRAPRALPPLRLRQPARRQLPPAGRTLCSPAIR